MLRSTITLPDEMTIGVLDELRRMLLVEQGIESWADGREVVFEWEPTGVVLLEDFVNEIAAQTYAGLYTARHSGEEALHREALRDAVVMAVAARSQWDEIEGRIRDLGVTWTEPEYVPD